jgi:hypothetical protein
MSLSFPLLISAVPLHEVSEWGAAAADKQGGAAEDAQVGEGDTPAPQAAASAAEGVDQLATGGRSSHSRIIAFRECWFSDGGIASNFPIHLFDAPLPVWPTFAINLVYPKTDDTKRMPVSSTGDPAKDAVWLPPDNRHGWQRTFQAIAGKTAFVEVGSFLASIVATMQNWRDLLLARAPGYRDRIVHVSLSPTEGGMNLNMDKDVLGLIARKGTAAGERFAEFSFDNHYWIRWRNVASALQRYVAGIARASDSQPVIKDNANAYSTARTGTPPPPSYRFTKDQQKEAEQLLHCLIRQGEEWEDELGADLSRGAPRPRPQMGITPTY